jgi:hypothetical protein
MEDLGPPIAYLALPDGVPVLGADGVPIGTVAHVLAAEEEDIFDGLVVAVGGGHRFADAQLVAELHERGAVLTIPGAEAARLPEPSANPAAMSADPDDVLDSRLAQRLRRAWDRISGNY